MNFYMTFENNTSSCLRTTLMNFFDPLQMLTIYLCHMDSILIHFSMKHCTQTVLKHVAFIQA